MSGWTTFLLQVKQAQEDLKCSRSGAWYRGVSRSSYALLPKLFRKPFKPEAEANIYRAYLRTRMAHPSAGSWAHLVDMQHYGTATRLLDWTECFAVALFFAINNSVTDLEDPCIWILNPFTLSCRTRGENNKSIGDFHIDLDMDYYRRFLRNKDWPYEYPMPFYSPTPNERIRVQRGFFTVHGKSDKPLEKTCARHVRQVAIPKNAMDEAREFLKLAGIDHNFLFPDQEGWLKKVEQDYFYTPEEALETKLPQ